MAMASSGMYKNQLQELAQRSCFNLPSYTCIRKGPDHAPRFMATVNFNGEIFESPSYYSTLRQAEHAAAEVALSTLSRREPSQSLAARILDETGVCKNLLQETAQRAGVSLPVYTTIRYGPGHLPVFKCSVEVAGMRFAGDPAKTKKQAEKNAAMAAWSALKQASLKGSERFLELPDTSGERERSAESFSSLYQEEWDTWQRNQSFNFPAVNKDLGNQPSTKLGQSRSRSRSRSRARFSNTSLAGYSYSSSVELPFETEKSLQSGGTNVVGSSYSAIIGSCSQLPLQKSLHELPMHSREALIAARLPQSLANKGGTLPVQNRGLPLHPCRQNRELSRALEEHIQDEDEWLFGEGSKLSIERTDTPVQIRGLPLHSHRQDHEFSRVLEEHFRDEEKWLMLGESSKLAIERDESVGVVRERSNSFREIRSSFGASVLDNRRSSSFREDRSNFSVTLEKERSSSFRDYRGSFTSSDKECSSSLREADKVSLKSSMMWPSQPRLWQETYAATTHGSSSGLKLASNTRTPLQMMTVHSTPFHHDHPSHQIEDLQFNGDRFRLATNLAPPVKVRSMVAVCSSPPSRRKDAFHSQFREIDDRAPHMRHCELLPQIAEIDNSFGFVTNLAPPVRVRPMVAVRSAPPLHCDPTHSQTRGIVDHAHEEAVSRQLFSQMRL